MKTIGVDVGGTFTDIILTDSETGEHLVYKLPSTPESQDVAVVNGIAELLRRNKIGASEIDLIVHGTTVATNAMLERRGARVVLITTAGLEDVLEIGRQNREDIYSLNASRPAPLVERNDRLGVKERLDYRGHVITPLEDPDIERIVQEVRARDPQSVAVSLLFSFLNNQHERAIAESVSDSTDCYVVSSSEVLPEFREFERTSTTVLEAYLGPLVVGYLERLDTSLSSVCRQSRLTIMQSNGGTLLASRASGNAIGLAISGLAGGAIGGWEIARRAGISRAITLDMGGTSCDISAINGGVSIRPDNEVAGLPLRTPSVDVKTIGAGGGSIAWVDHVGVLHVGPQSAGAVPGPASYARGGNNATVTDANLVLGRLNAEYFLGGRVPLDMNLARKAVKQTADTLGIGIAEAALGIIRISTSNMVQAIREVTIERGADPRTYVLVAFGGAGPTQAVDIAESLGINRILVPPFPGITSALGLVCADLRVDLMKSTLLLAESSSSREMVTVLRDLSDQASARLLDQGAEQDSVVIQWAIDMRHTGQSHELQVPVTYESEDILRESIQEFDRMHRETYGYTMEDREKEWVTARVSARSVANEYRPIEHKSTTMGEPVGVREILEEGGLHSRALIYRREELGRGQVVEGPCVVEQMDTTTYVASGWQAIQQTDGTLMLRRNKHD
ncbi:MAG: hydantoinase/oxoprolinase family protein [Candidatus Thorarchaeota archaeon]